ncbi:MAG: hypothetical protein KDA41_09545, partial [Planctomycetales bacterium]|nr:hypothetical protein [Planctomycetales bacterium]
LWIVLGILGGGVLMSLACALGGFFIFRNSFSANREDVVGLAHTIADWDIPEYWRPAMSMSMFGVRMAMFNGDQGRGAFVLVDAMEEVRKEREAFEDEMRVKINQKMNRQMQSERETEVKSYTDEFQINGAAEEMDVKITKGALTGEQYIEVSGSFQGKQRLAFVFIKAPENEFGEEQIRAMFASAAP